MLGISDDNEETFRRAAENYPLNTNNPDWQALRKKMGSEEAPFDFNHAKIRNKRKYRRLFLLLLLFPLVVIEYKYSGISNLFNNSPRQDSLKQVAIKPKELQTNAEIKPENKNSLPAALVKQYKTLSSIRNLSDNNSSDTHHSVQTQKLVTNAERDVAVTYSAPKTHGASKKKLINIAPLIPQKRKQPKETLYEPDEKINSLRLKSSFATKQKVRVAITDAQTTENETDTRVVLAEKIDIPVESPIKEETHAEGDDIITKKEEFTKNKPTSEMPKINYRDDKPKRSKLKHFYTSLIAGPDFSTVKLQSVKKVGINFGLIAGYRINNKFSIETGLLKDKKYYSSEGEYFSTKKIRMPSNASIEYVAGNCKMLELPLNLYYAFIRRTNTTWKVSTGISSYFMNKEIYTFNVKRNGIVYPYTANYETRDNQLFAVINFSLGWACEISRIGSLRIEPYLKLPLNKIGTGDLPIQSGGIMIGFTRNLF